PSAAPRPMLGFGNPLLDGYRSRPGDKPEAVQRAKDHAEWAREARAKQRCQERGPQQVASARGGSHGDGVPVETRGLANTAYIKMQTPLPATADELCAVAQGVKAERSDIHLGAQATEHEVKRLSEARGLAKYRMVHFATHGALAGELGKGYEPGLILTP